MATTIRKSVYNLESTQARKEKRKVDAARATLKRAKKEVARAARVLDKSKRSRRDQRDAKSASQLAAEGVEENPGPPRRRFSKSNPKLQRRDLETMINVSEWVNFFHAHYNDFTPAQRVRMEKIGGLLYADFMSREMLAAQGIEPNPGPPKRQPVGKPGGGRGARGKVSMPKPQGVKGAQPKKHPPKTEDAAAILDAAGSGPDRTPLATDASAGSSSMPVPLVATMKGTPGGRAPGSIKGPPPKVGLVRANARGSKGGRAIDRALAEAVADDAQRAAGNADAMREKAEELAPPPKTREQVEAEKLEAFSEKMRFGLRDIGSLALDEMWVSYLPQSDSLGPVSFLPSFLPKLRCLSTKLAASVEERDLPHPLNPHSVLHFRKVIIGERPSDSVTVEQGEHRLLRNQVTRAEPFSLTVKYLCTHVRYGFNHVRESLADLDDVEVDLPKLAEMARARIGQDDMHLTYRGVVAFLSRDTMDNSKEKNREQQTYTHDLCVAALLSLMQKPFNPPTSFFDLAEESASRRALPYLARIQGGVLTPGHSIIGYDVHVQDVFQGAIDISRRSVPFVHRIKRAFNRAMAYAEETRFLRMHGFHSAFPNPFTRRNLLLGFFKRVGIRRLRPTAEMAQRFGEVVGELGRQMCVARQEFTDEEVMDACREHAADKGFADAEMEDYVSGANDALTGNVTTAMNYYKSFVKDETYPTKSRKPVRFIMAPTHYYRGFFHALLYRAQHRFFEAVSAHSVKGMPTGELDELMMKQLGGHSWFVASDFTSMESNIQREQIYAEGEILARADPILGPAIRAIFRTLAETDQTIVISRDIDMVLEPMRMSGQDHTSVGNYINNFAWSFAVLSKYCAVEPDEVGDFVHNYDRPYFFEGDDGIICVGDRPDQQRLDVVAGDMGVRLKFEVAAKATTLGFCKATLVDALPEAPVRLKDPLELLARVFTGFKTSALAEMDAAAIQISTARSYVHEFGGVPIIGPVCAAIVEQYGHMDEALRRNLQALRDGLPVSSDALGVKAREIYALAKARGQDALLSALTETTLIKTQITDKVRQQAAELYPVCSVPFQHLVESALVQQIRSGVRQLECPALVNNWARRLKELGMRTVERVDVRDAARDYGERVRAHLPQDISSVKEKMTGWLDSASVWLTGMMPFGIFVSIYLPSMWFYWLASVVGFILLTIAVGIPLRLCNKRLFDFWASVMLLCFFGILLIPPLCMLGGCFLYSLRFTRSAWSCWRLMKGMLETSLICTRAYAIVVKDYLYERYSPALAVRHRLIRLRANAREKLKWPRGDTLTKQLCDYLTAGTPATDHEARGCVAMIVNADEVEAFMPLARAWVLRHSDTVDPTKDYVPIERCTQVDLGALDG